MTRIRKLAAVWMLLAGVALGAFGATTQMAHTHAVADGGGTVQPDSFLPARTDSICCIAACCCIAA
jgi:hypothetical protein